MRRRDFLVAGVGGLTASLVWRRGSLAVAADVRQHPDFETLERSVGGRLGVAALDTATDRTLAWRAGERFPMCSTFKWLLAAQVLSRADASQESLSRALPYGESDLLDHAPITRARLGEGRMSISDLCEAAIRYSDNTAANLLLRTVGGPAGFTSYLRAIGDGVTRLDRMEPDLNSAEPGDPRDTTTPEAMLANLKILLLGQRLAVASRELLSRWLVENTTGAGKLRAGVPADWRMGDKTGMGANGATNDVAIAWPPGGAPILVAAYLTETDADLAARNAVLARVGRIVAQFTSRPES